MTATVEHLEREVKLAVWPGFALPDFDGLAHGLVATPAADQRLEAVYFDTPDLRLARSGITLRHRSGEGWTLKLPDGGGEGVTDTLARRELTVAADREIVPAELFRLVTAWVRSSELVPVARLDTHRRTVVLSDGQGTTMGEVVDDEVEVLQDRGVALRFREVEVELGERAPEELLDEVVVHLRAAGAVGPGDPIPKVKRALGPQAFEPPDLAGQPHDDGTAASVIHAGLRASVRRLLEHDLGARLGNVEGVHQARVATRRLRSDLHTFGRLLEERSVSDVRAELRWLAAALGEVRDADVLLQRLHADVTRLPDIDAGAATTLLARLEAERSDARRRLLEVLDSHRYAVLLDRLVAGVDDGSVDSAAGGWLLAEAHAPATEVLPGLVARPWKRLRKAARAAGAT
ncbi:MAG TPA: CYTH and CHAD domain-containing protein, partial [Acidimicrobiales bacterium]|nr:CYTH and CHAD domain-containing protein [Acidimicrobiales bacterium]